MASALLALALTAAAPVRLPDGRALNLQCTGTGVPTVLLEGGFAMTVRAWDKVIALVAPTNRICAYDRAGYGLSDPGPLPRDGVAVARDLEAAVRAAAIAGPYIVVGHSAGGLYARLFADRRPDIAAMVLVDPSIEFQDVRLAALFGPGAGSLASLRARAERCLAAALRPDPGAKPCTSTRAALWATQISELDALWTSTSDAVAAGRASYGAMPLIILTAGDRTGPVADAYAGFHAEIAARSTRGVRRTVAGASHLMMRDRPDAIAAAITEAAAALGTPRPIG